MSTCYTTPTATQTDVITTDMVSMGYSTSVVDGGESTSTIITSVCGAGANCSTVTSFRTVSGESITSTIPYTITVPLIVSTTTTLYSTSCSQLSNSAGSQLSDSAGSSSEEASASTVDISSSDAPSAASQSTALTQSDVPFTSDASSPTTAQALTTTWQSTEVVVTSIVTASSTSNGSVAVFVSTVVSTAMASRSSSASSLALPPTGPGNAGIPMSTSSNNSGNSSNVAAIAGGCIGAAFGVVVITAMIWFFLKRRRIAWDGVFNTEDEVEAHIPDSTMSTWRGALNDKKRSRMSFGSEAKPKPYEYGVVGRAQSPPQASQTDLHDSLPPSAGAYSAANSQVHIPRIVPAILSRPAQMNSMPPSSPPPSAPQESKLSLRGSSAARDRSSIASPEVQEFRVGLLGHLQVVNQSDSTDDDVAGGVHSRGASVAISTRPTSTTSVVSTTPFLEKDGNRD
ncbi:hypothetical protein FISHEDRAFT_79005 [Fistulina hepatica ATCC 64428]|uniref:Uncharacterized protein n=1 Tax=Fistulina hepatica ATCC 64428 TaxID=1128425 RepID=A0A0D6ZZL0_9AGAR|nr:hypothetical protein FISHEDRAFT_79005 [Fistulina hepatica ATCC 64428]